MDMEVLTNQELSAIKGGKWVLIDGEWFGLTLILIQIINASHASYFLYVGDHVLKNNWNTQEISRGFVN
jgi:bacteriocin-like protein